jgi:hypothetical protein
MASENEFSNLFNDSNIFSNLWYKGNSPPKIPENFERYKEDIVKTKAYIKAKREAFYKNNDLKDR